MERETAVSTLSRSQGVYRLVAPCNTFERKLPPVPAIRPRNALDEVFNLLHIFRRIRERTADVTGSGNRSTQAIPELRDTKTAN
jgi:hypothetical protein